jgi:hypothetical protein
MGSSETAAPSGILSMWPPCAWPPAARARRRNNIAGRDGGSLDTVMGDMVRVVAMPPVQPESKAT